MRIKRSKTRRITVERLLLAVVVMTAIIIIFVNVSLLTTTITESEDHHSVTTTHRKTISDNNINNNNYEGAVAAAAAARIGNQIDDNNTKKEDKPSQSQPQKNNAKQNENNKDYYAVDEKLMRILRHVGIQNATSLTEEDRRQLPSWDQVVERVGNDGPIILGLDNCKAYNTYVADKTKRHLAVADPSMASGGYFSRASWLKLLSHSADYQEDGQVA